jgi:hypothetical protein
VIVIVQVFVFFTFFAVTLPLALTVATLMLLDLYVSPAVFFDIFLPELVTVIFGVSFFFDFTV